MTTATAPRRSRRAKVSDKLTNARFYALLVWSTFMVSIVCNTLVEVTGR